MTKTLLAFLLFSTFLIALPREAKAGCWYETAYYEKWGCKVIDKLNNGKYVLICCD